MKTDIMKYTDNAKDKNYKLHVRRCYHAPQ